MIGQTISHYKILSKLGEGGMGVVYKAEDEKLRRTVALKFPPIDKLAGEREKTRFAREAQAAAALNHPNICTVYDIDEAGGRPFIVMEFVEGESVKERLQTRPLPLKEALEIAVQAAQGLQAAHEEGIVHRDVKSANLMVTAHGRVKVMDFGLAQVGGRSHLTKTGATLGTASYMSPEQALAQQLDCRTDIWSLGVVLYEMLTGSLPFEGEVVGAVAYAVIHTEAEPPTARRSGLPVELDHILDKALAKKQDERYQHIEDMLVDLRAVQSGRGGVKPVSRRRKLSRRVVVRAGAAAALGAIMVLAALDVGGVRGRLAPETAAPRIESLAVLPLANLSGDPTQDHLADGITDALITDLARLEGLGRVIARSSVVHYKGTNQSPQEIARELNVDALITGAVMRSDERLRLTIQLINPVTGEQLWADRYERDLRDVLALQNEILSSITGQLQVRLTPRDQERLARARPVDPEAYEAYLKGRIHWFAHTPEDVETAHGYFQFALEKDPDFALAHMGMGYVLVYRAAMGIPPRELLPEFKKIHQKVLQLDDSLPEVHEGIADVKFYYEWDWEAAGESYRRALELKPNSADMRLFYWDFLAAMNRLREARAEIERCLELDPHNAFAQASYGLFLLTARRYDDAIAQFGKTLVMAPDFDSAHLGLWSAHHHKGVYEEALAEARESFARGGDSEMVAEMDRGYDDDGYVGAMRHAAETMAVRSRQIYILPTHIARLYAYAGEKAAALEWLERGYQDRDSGMVHLQIDPDWDSLREEPEFQDLLRRMNFPK